MTWRGLYGISSERGNVGNCMALVYEDGVGYVRIDRYGVGKKWNEIL